jgi:hypothetical protein
VEHGGGNDRSRRADLGDEARDAEPVHVERGAVDLEPAAVQRHAEVVGTPHQLQLGERALLRAELPEQVSHRAGDDEHVRTLLRWRAIPATRPPPAEQLQRRGENDVGDEHRDEPVHHTSNGSAITRGDRPSAEDTGDPEADEVGAALASPGVAAHGYWRSSP